MSFQTVEQLQAQIASLTAENERLRGALGQWGKAREAAHEALQTAQELNSVTHAALQPKEGEQ